MRTRIILERVQIDPPIGTVFDGNMKELLLTFPKKSNYTGYVIHVSSNTYSKNYMIHFWGAFNNSDGTIYIEHNLYGPITYFTAYFIYVKN